MTKQDIARIYGMYIGCDVITPPRYDDKTTAYLTGFSEFDETLELQYFCETHAEEEPDNVPMEDCRLHLYSLEDISDEDKIAVAQIVMPHIGNDDYAKYIGFGIVIFHFEGYTPYDGSGFDTAVSRQIITDVSVCQAIAIGDYLRSRGYALTNDLFTPLPDGTVVAIRKTK